MWFLSPCAIGLIVPPFSLGGMECSASYTAFPAKESRDAPSPNLSVSSTDFPQLLLSSSDQAVWSALRVVLSVSFVIAVVSVFVLIKQ